MVTTPKKVISVLPLENGDRLSRYEFERRYQAMPHLRIMRLGLNPHYKTKFTNYELRTALWA